MTKRMELAVAALQEAIDEEMERKAKLGYKAVIADENGNPVVVAKKHWFVNDDEKQQAIIEIK